MEDGDFEYQLQQQELESKVKNEAGASNSNIFKDPNDGTEYEWDYEKKAWFPRINDDFIAQYQSQYGIFEEDTKCENKQTPTESDEEQIQSPLNSEQKVESVNQNEEPKSRKRPEEPPQWFEVSDDHNTNVYVSNLPLDITEEEFVQLMKKCGLIMKDDRYLIKFSIANLIIFII